MLYNIYIPNFFLESYLKNESEETLFKENVYEL